MVTFLHYLDGSEFSLEDRVNAIFEELGISVEQQEAIKSFLAPIKVKDQSTYEHCLRVGILAKAIGDFIHFDGRALFYSGILHDIGKAMTKQATLQNKGDWSPEDADEIKSHVVDGYRLIRDYFDFSAEIILWHHRFQKGGYPETLPPPLHGYSEGTKAMIPLYGRMLALADAFDALHRVNSKFGLLTG